MWLVIVLLFIAGVLLIINRFYQPSGPSYKSSPSPPQTTTNKFPEIKVTCYTSESDYQKANPQYTYNPNEVSTQFMRMLIYFGKADGQLRDDEIKIIAEFLRSEQPEHKQSDTSYLISCIREIKPFTAEEYKEFLGYLSKDTIKKITIWCGLVVGTQRKNHPFEDHLLDELESMGSK